MNKKPTMFEAAKKVMGLMEQLTARQIIVRLKDNGRKEVPTPRQLAQRFRTDQEINVIKSRSKKDETIFKRLQNEVLKAIQLGLEVIIFYTPLTFR